MTDTPIATNADQMPLPSGMGGWLSGWSEERRRNLFLITYSLSLLITAAAIWLVAEAPGTSGDGARDLASRAVLWILAINLALILALAVVVGRRAIGLFRRRDDAGARLHLRFVALFSMVALVPSILIAWYSACSSTGAWTSGSVTMCSPP